MTRLAFRSSKRRRPAPPSPLPVTSGLRAWYAGDAISTLPADGAALASWTDSSSNGRHTTQPSTTQRPVYRKTGDFLPNAKPVIEFSRSAAQFLETTVPANTATTRFVVCRFKTTNDADLLGSNAGFEFGAYAGELTVWGNDKWVVDAAVNAGQTLQADRWYVMAMASNGTNSTTQYINGVVDGSTSAVAFSVATAGPLSIGAQYNGDYAFNGFLAEVIDYSRVLTGTEITQVNDYLEAKYGIGEGGSASIPTLNLRAWYKGDAIAGPPANGASVSSWTDSSGGGLHAVTGLTNPIYRTTGTFLPNGKPVLDFPTATTTNLNMPLPASAVSRFAVVYSRSFTNAPVVFGAGASYKLNISSGGKLESSVHNQTWLNIGTNNPTTLSVSNWYIVAFTGNGTNASAIYINGTLEASSTTAHTVTGTTAILGTASGGQQPWDGYIAEVIDYDRVLTSTELGTVHNYLRNKFNIGTVVLPPPTDPGGGTGSGIYPAGVTWKAPIGSNIPLGSMGDSNDSGTPTAMELRKEWDYWDVMGGSVVLASAEGIPAPPGGSDRVVRWVKNSTLPVSEVYQKLNRSFSNLNWPTAVGSTNNQSPADVSGIYVTYQYIPSAKWYVPPGGWVILTEFKENYIDSSGNFQQDAEWINGYNNFTPGPALTGGISPGPHVINIADYDDMWIKWEWRLYQGSKDATGGGGRLELWVNGVKKGTGLDSTRHVGSGAYGPMANTRAFIYIAGQYSTNNGTAADNMNITSYIGPSYLIPITSPG